MNRLRLDQAQGVLDALAMCGVKVRLDGDQLRLSAPKGALSDEDRQVVADYKPEMIALLTPPAPPFPPMPWRAELPNLPVALRDRWGHRANALEDEGLHWRDAEEQAFREITSSLEGSRPSKAA